MNEEINSYIRSVSVDQCYVQHICLHYIYLLEIKTTSAIAPFSISELVIEDGSTVIFIDIIKNRDSDAIVIV